MSESTLYTLTIDAHLLGCFSKGGKMKEEDFEEDYTEDTEEEYEETEDYI